MPTTEEIVDFSEPPVPVGESPWVIPQTVEQIEVVAADPGWPMAFGTIAQELQQVLGARALQIDHVGSTSVPGLAAKPVIDIDLIVADPGAEAEWLPDLERAGYLLTVREPWWQGHRCLRKAVPRTNLHVFGPAAAEPWKHRILRDHLRRVDRDRELYAATKQAAADRANARGETVMQYNQRKEQVIREIYARAFRAAGLTATTSAVNAVHHENQLHQRNR